MKRQYPVSCSQEIYCPFYCPFFDQNIRFRVDGMDRTDFGL